LEDVVKLGGVRARLAENHLQALARRERAAEYERLLPLAEKQDGPAMYKLGMWHASDPAGASNEQALKWFKMAVVKGGPSAALARNQIERMTRPAENETLSSGLDDLIAKATTEQNPLDMFKLGVFYSNAGMGADAWKWFSAAAGFGHAGAMFRLGDMQYHGRLVPKNEEQGFAWLVMASEKGNADANRMVTAINAERARQRERDRLAKQTQDILREGLADAFGKIADHYADKRPSNTRGVLNNTIKSGAARGFSEGVRPYK
jgi:TPR repeat protein